MAARAYPYIRYAPSGALPKQPNTASAGLCQRAIRNIAVSTVAEPAEANGTWRLKSLTGEVLVSISGNDRSKPFDMVLDNTTLFSQAFMKELFASPRKATAGSLAQAAQYKEKLCHTPQVDSFHLELKIGPPTQIPWSCNSKALLGCRQLSYESFIRRIHPDYRELYFHFGVAAYRLSIKHKDLLQTQQVSYNIVLPLRHEDGRYLWFKQVSVPTSFDTEGVITHHVNSYRLVCEFQESLLLSRPLVVFQASSTNPLQQELQQLSTESTLDLMFAQHLEEHAKLTQNHRRILLAWCKVYAEHGPEHTNHQSVAKELGIKAASLKKYVQPILAAAREVFPLHPMKEMNDLGRLMVGLFGVG